MLYVKCHSCGTETQAEVQMPASELSDASIEQEYQNCPHCGSPIKLLADDIYEK